MAQAGCDVERPKLRAIGMIGPVPPGRAHLTLPPSARLLRWIRGKRPIREPLLQGSENRQPDLLVPPIHMDLQPFDESELTGGNHAEVRNWPKTVVELGSGDLDAVERRRRVAGARPVECGEAMISSERYGATTVLLPTDVASPPDPHVTGV